MKRLHVKRVLAIVIGSISILSVLSISSGNSGPVSDKVLSFSPPQAQGSNESQIFVVVTDKSGRSIKDLKLQDFSIWENGKQTRVLEAVPASSTPVMMSILVDFSGSAHEQEHRRQNMEALARFFKNNLRDPDGVFLVAFGMSTFQLTGVTSNPAEFDQGIKSLLESQPIGATALYDSLFTVATTRFQGLPGHRVILVLSDFQDNSSRRTLDNCVQAMQNAGVTVFGLVEQGDTGHPGRDWKKGARAAQRITTETGGEALTYSSPRDLESQLNYIWADLKGSYLLKYQPSAPLKSGVGLKLKVELQRMATVIRFPEHGPAGEP